MHANVHEGCMDTVREPALKVDLGRKIPYHNREANLPQQVQRCANSATSLMLLCKRGWPVFVAFQVFDPVHQEQGGVRVAWLLVRSPADGHGLAAVPRSPPVLPLLSGAGHATALCHHLRSLSQGTLPPRATTDIYNSHSLMACNCKSTRFCGIFHVCKVKTTPQSMTWLWSSHRWRVWNG